MRKIYDKADCVWIWLGLAFDDDENRLAVQKMREMHSALMSARDAQGGNLLAGLAAFTPEDPSFFPKPDTKCFRAWQGIQEICNQSWWQRCWVAQEATGENPQLFFCGSQCFEWRHIFAATEIAFQLSRTGKLPIEFQKSMASGSARAMWKFLLRREKPEALALLEALHRLRNLRSSDARDKVYAPRNVASNLPLNMLVPDYRKSVKDVFIDVARTAMAMSDGSLDFLGYSCRPAEDALHMGEIHTDLPSWIPDWRYRMEIWPLSNSHGLDAKDQKVIYRASGSDASIASIDDDSLQVYGYPVDKITWISSIWETDYFDCTYVKSWARGMDGSAMYNAGGTVSEAFNRTLVADISLDNRGRRARGAAVNWALVEGLPGHGDHLLKERMEAAITMCSYGRRMCKTDKGYLGLVPAAAKIGDAIALFLGASVLHVLRKAQENQYHYVGESFVNGLMDGEIMSWPGIRNSAPKLYRLV